MIIYKATNTINDKVYIGLTTHTLEHRRKIHERDALRKDTYFYRAMRKYGKENFAWEIIDCSATTMEELEELEKAYIKFYNSFDNKEKGYNTQSGGNSLFKITEEEKRKRSERAKGENNPMYGVPSPMKGKKFSEEHKRKISEALKKVDREHVKGSNNPAARKVRNILTGEIYGTVKEAAEKTGISRASVTQVCQGKKNSVKGLQFEYVDD